MLKTRLLICCLLPALMTGAAMQPTKAQTPATSATKETDAVPTLSAAQQQAIKRIHVESARRAAPAALRLAGIVHRVYENMLADKPDERLRARLSAEMEQAAWALLSIKGQAIHATVNVLTPAQKQLIKRELHKPGAPADLAEVIAHTFKLADK